MINYSCDRCCAPVVHIKDVVSIETSDMNGSPLCDKPYDNIDNDTAEVVRAMTDPNPNWSRHLCRNCNMKVRDFIDKWNDDAEKVSDEAMKP